MGGDLLHGLTTSDASRERYKVHLWVLDCVLCEFWREVDHLDHGRRNTSAGEGQGKAFCGKGGLGRWLEQHTVSSDNRW